MSETTAAQPDRALVIAHRGASADAPENTIAAFELAIEQGADAIELDVHLSRDRQPVVIHDFTLERTTDGAGRVGQHTVRELKRLDAGGWRSTQFRGQRLQMLQEVLERFRGRTRFVIDLKGDSTVDAGLGERVVSMLEIYEVVEDTLVQSYDHGVLAETRALNPDIRVAVRLTEAAPEPGFCPAFRRQAVCLPVDLATGPLITQMRETDVPCYVGVVNEPALAERLFALGVSGLFTDSPVLVNTRPGR